MIHESSVRIAKHQAWELPMLDCIEGAGSSVFVPVTFNLHQPNTVQETSLWLVATISVQYLMQIILLILKMVIQLWCKMAFVGEVYELLGELLGECSGKPNTFSIFSYRNWLFGEHGPLLYSGVDGYHFWACLHVFWINISASVRMMSQFERQTDVKLMLCISYL